MGTPGRPGDQGWELIAEGRHLLRTHWTEDAEAALGRFNDAYAIAQSAPAPADGDGDPARSLHVQCCYWRIAALTSLGRWRDAEEQIYHLVDIADGYDMTHYAWGRYFLEGGAYEDAVARLDEALKINPRNERALRDRLRASRLSDSPDTVALAQAALRVIPDSLALRSELVLSLLWSDDPADLGYADLEAAEAFERFGGLRETHVLLARVLTAQARYPDALTRCAKALVVDDRYWDALLLQQWLWEKEKESASTFPGFHVVPGRIPDFPGRYSKAVLSDTLDSSSILDEAEALDDQQKFADAVPLYERVIGRFPGNLRAQHGRLRSLRLMRDYQLAATTGAALVERFPGSWQLRQELGLVSHDQGDLDEALNWFDAAQKLAPNEVDICVARSMCLCSLRRYAAARRGVKLLLSARPDDFRLLEEDAWISYHEGMFAAATQGFDRLLHRAEDDATRARINYGLGYVAFARGEYSDAQNHFLQARTEHGIPAYRVAYAWSLARSDDPGDLQEAQDICHEILEVNEADPAAHLCRGVVYFKLGYLADSKRDLERALEISPAQGSRTDLGALYAKMKEFDAAESELREAIRQDPQDAMAHVELGSLLLETGDGGLRAAKLEFQRAKAIDRNLVSAVLGLAQCQRLDGNPAKAEEELRSAIGRVEGGDQWRLHAALAHQLVASGLDQLQSKSDQRDRQLLSDAYDAACAAIDKAPKIAEPQYLAGFARLLMAHHAEFSGRRGWLYASAMRHFRSCLDIDKDHKAARRELTALQGDLAERRRSLPGRYLLGVVGFALLGLSVASLFKRVQMSSEVFIIVFLAGIALLGVAVLYDMLKRIQGPAGLNIEFNQPDPVVAVGPVGKLAESADRVDLPPYLAFARPRREVIVGQKDDPGRKDA